MYHLMKYEVRKQLLSKIIILSLFVLLELFLLFGILLKNNDFITVTNGILKMVAVTGMLYLILEPAIAYEKDLGQKQGYLLFMTPRKNAAIVGAKLLVEALAFGLMFSLIVGVFTMNDSLLSGIYGRDVHQLDAVFNSFGDVGFSFSEYLVTLFFLLFICVDIITTAFLSISISYYYFSKAKINSIFSFALFIILFILEFCVMGFILVSLFNGSGIVKKDIIIFEGMLFLIPAALNFIGTVIMLDKKVSL